MEEHRWEIIPDTLPNHHEAFFCVDHLMEGSRFVEMLKKLVEITVEKGYRIAKVDNSKVLNATNLSTGEPLTVDNKRGTKMLVTFVKL